jgi:hypothetical protein
VERAVPITPAMLAPKPVAAASRPRAIVAPAQDWEQWFGRRALLGVGVLALIATAGFFLKYAIDRGWISPWVRVNGGVLLGALIAIWGDRLIERGLRLYGGALIGAGGALAYLALWAAAAPYELIAGKLGILLLFGVTVAVAARAVRRRVEALCAWALLGALCAPFFVQPPSSDITTLLAYLALVAGGCGAIAARLNWRRTFLLAVGGYYFMPWLAPRAELDVPMFAAYLAIGGLATMLATERRRWPESRLVGLGATWLGLWALAGAPDMADARWLILGCVFALAVVTWRYHIRYDAFAHDDRAEALVFVATPCVAVALLASAGPPALERAGGIVPSALALLYLVAGWPRRSVALVAMGFALVALAIAGQWDGEAVAVGWSALALIGVVADHSNGQPAGRPAATVLATVALLQLFFVSRSADWLGHVAFTDRWSLAWYVCTAAWAAAATLWRVRADDARWLAGGRSWLWGVAGLSLWFGGSLELAWAFTNPLARDLAISAFWLAYAAALVATGFRLGQRTVRVAGLGLAGVAALKIVLYDLSALEALYRVGSFFALAIIALAVAYSYNRRKLESHQ